MTAAVRLGLVALVYLSQVQSYQPIHDHPIEKKEFHLSTGFRSPKMRASRVRRLGR